MALDTLENLTTTGLMTGGPSPPVFLSAVREVTFWSRSTPSAASFCSCELDMMGEWVGAGVWSKWM